MQQIRTAIQSMISISNEELDLFLNGCFVKKFKRKSILSRPDVIPNEIFFINKGLLRMVILDNNGVEHTTHFALENQFICDYSSFIQRSTSVYSLQALEDTEVVILPRTSIEYGYKHLKEGEKLGRLIAEFYFIYQDERIKNQYARTPKQRYDNITNLFPNIHNRVSQRLIASFLGISPVHLSRLKKAEINQKSSKV